MNANHELRTVQGSVHADDWFQLSCAMRGTNKLAGENVVFAEISADQPATTDPDCRMVDLTIRIGHEALFQSVYDEIQQHRIQLVPPSTS